MALEVPYEILLFISVLIGIISAVAGAVRIKSNQIKHSVKLETISANDMTELKDDVLKLKNDAFQYGIFQNTINARIAEKADRSALGDLNSKVARLEGRFDEHRSEGKRA